MNIKEIEQLDAGTNRIKNAPTIVVRASECYRPTSYGREINQNHVNRIAAVFDYNKLGEIAVALVPSKEGLYEVNDGIHRIQSMRITFGPDVEFRAIRLPEGLTIEERAREYAMRNRNRMPMLPVDMFRADVIMKDSEALEIVQICKEMDCGIYRFNVRSKQYPNITSIRDLRTLHKSGNLRQALYIIRSAYDDAPHASSNKAMTAHLLRGLNKFLTFFKDDDKIKEKRLIALLGRHPSKHWLAVIQHDMHYTPEGVSAIVREYNKNLNKPFQLSNSKWLLGEDS